MKKFEPHYRLVRVGLASKIEKASRQQRAYLPLRPGERPRPRDQGEHRDRSPSANTRHRQATQEPTEDPPWYREGQGQEGQEGEIDDSPPQDNPLSHDLAPFCRSCRVPSPPPLLLLLIYVGKAGRLFRVGFWSGICKGYLSWLCGWLRRGRMGEKQNWQRGYNTYPTEVLHLSAMQHPRQIDMT